MNNKKFITGLVTVLIIILIFGIGYFIGAKKTVRDIRGRAYAGLRPQKMMDRIRTARPGGIMQRPGTQAYEQEVWDPFMEMQRMRKVMNRMFNSSFRRAVTQDESGMFRSMAGFEPDIDVKEEKDRYIVKVDLPGVEKDSINIVAKPNSLTISGERAVESEVADERAGFFTAERSFGAFSRTIPLPNRIDANNVTADTSKGVLVIDLPKEVAGERGKESGVSVKVK